MENKAKQRNICLTVAYDGTDYCGFQSQRGTGLPTVQQALEDGLEKLIGTFTPVIGSGRTDGGVHAWGQVVNFLTDSTIQPERYKLALRQYIPENIVIRDSKLVPEAFHARFDAKEKTYIYHLYCHRQMSPFYQRYAYHVPYTLDLTAMQQAAVYFEGVHDFRGFCPANTPLENFVREIYECSVNIGQDNEIFGGNGLGTFTVPPLVTVTVRGNGFLWNMVRIITGTLLKVGEGKIKPQELPALIGFGQRKKAGKTMPPQGLFLYEVKY